MGSDFALSSMISKPAANYAREKPNIDIEEIIMRRLICCKYHEDSQTVELRYTGGTLIDIDCMAVEDEVARNMYERSELDYLLTHDPVGYADLILNGDVEAYLRNV